MDSTIEKSEYKTLFLENEYKTNKIFAYSMLIGAFMLGLVLLLNVVGVFNTDLKIITSIVWQSSIELIIPAVICLVLKGKKKFLKYLMLFMFIIVLGRIDAFLGYNATLVMVIPVIMSTRYYQKNLTIIVAIVTAIIFGLGAYSAARYNLGVFDLNFYDITFEQLNAILNNWSSDAETLKEAIKAIMGSGNELGIIDVPSRIYDYVVRGFVPRLMIFMIAAFICGAISNNGQNMIIEQYNASKKSARIESELNLATDIQIHMLPSNYPNYEEFSVYGRMKAAKEVGGDFYDFFMTRDDKVAIVIGDVSGKGIPAALFMVIAKTLIKTYLTSGQTPGECLTTVNKLLCDGNEQNIFVTIWLGILDLNTGRLTFSSAGHNPAIIKNKGKIEYLRIKNGFVLAGLESSKYRDETILLNEGDRVFLYTDGVTEATNINKELYGEKALIETIRNNDNLDTKALVKAVKKSVDEFANGYEQSDDITMLLLDFKKKKFDSLRIEAELSNLNKVLEYVASKTKKLKLTDRIKMNIETVIEEVYVNIASYAYKDLDNVEKICELNIYIDDYAKLITFEFKDHGHPFNPINKDDPDITLKAEQRDIGGLGIYMTKKMMDKVDYKYIDNTNTLVLTKRFE